MRKAKPLDTADGEQRTRDYFIHEMPFAYAYHQMLFDDLGVPTDYIFLDVNPAFESITSLKKENIVGRRVTEVLPGIREDPANWIKVYGEVVQNHQENQIMCFCLL